MSDEPDYEDARVFLEHVQRHYGEQAGSVLRQAVEDILDLPTMAEILTDCLTREELAEFFEP